MTGESLTDFQARQQAFFNQLVDNYALMINPPIILHSYYVTGLWLEQHFPSWLKHYYEKEKP